MSSFQHISHVLSASMRRAKKKHAIAYPLCHTVLFSVQLHLHWCKLHSFIELHHVASRTSRFPKRPPSSLDQHLSDICSTHLLEIHYQPARLTTYHPDHPILSLVLWLTLNSSFGRFSSPHVLHMTACFSNFPVPTSR